MGCAETMDDYITRILGRGDIDRDTEARWAREARRGDRRARAKLIESGLRPVVLRALMLGYRGDALTEAVQNGTVALIEAVDRFDPDRGTRLATFAWWPVSRAMRVTASELPLAGEAEPTEASSSGGLEGWLDGLRPELAAVISRRYTANAVRPRRIVARELGISEYMVRAREAEALRELAAGLARVGDRAPQRRVNSGIRSRGSGAVTHDPP